MGEAGLIRDKLKKSEGEVRELQTQVRTPRRKTVRFDHFFFALYFRSINTEKSPRI